MMKQRDQSDANEVTSDAIPEATRREIIRKLAGVAAGAVLVTVLLEERSEAS